MELYGLFKIIIIIIIKQKVPLVSFQAVFR